MATYYIDGSDAVATDPGGVWTSDASAFDGSIATFATCTTVGSSGSNFLMAEGTNAPADGFQIGLVRFRIYKSPQTAGGSISTTVEIYTDGLGALLGSLVNTDTSTGYKPYVNLSTPAGGWTWAKLQALESKVYITSDPSGAVTERIALIELEVSVAALPNNYQFVKVGDGVSTSEKIR